MIFKKRTGFKESLQPANWHELGKKGREGRGIDEEPTRRTKSGRKESPKYQSKCGAKAAIAGQRKTANRNERREKTEGKVENLTNSK